MNKLDKCTFISIYLPKQFLNKDINIMVIPKETLEAIKNELPHGAQVDIARETQYSAEYVNMVINGIKPITDSNMVIISLAQKKIREKREAVAALTKDIQDTLNQISE